MRTELVLTSILLACPDELDRTLYGLRDRDSLVDFVVRVTPAETAADKGIVDIDLFLLQAGGFRCIDDRTVGRLRSKPDIKPVGLQKDGRVQGLHRRMREIRCLIDGLERLGRA